MNAVAPPVVWIAIALYGFLFALGAGYAALGLGRRWGALWPAAAPVVGLAALVVATDLPAFFWSAQRYARPLVVILFVGSVVCAWRARRWLRAGRWWPAAVGIAATCWGIFPLIRARMLTTLSTGNYDFVYYQGLEVRLLQGAYRGEDLRDPASALERMVYVLRHGGWRAGIAQVGSALSALSGSLPHQVDGVLWGVCYGLLPGAAVAAHGLISPRSSRGSRWLVALAAGLSGPALMLVRDTFGAHLASLPLFVLGLTLLDRGSQQRAVGLRVLAALVIAAGLSVLADGAPYLIALGGAMAWMRARAAPWAKWRILDRWIAYGALACAMVPCTVARLIWSMNSLALTGYHGPRIDVASNDLLQLLPVLFGIGSDPVSDVRRGSIRVIVAVLTGLPAAIALVVGIRSQRRVQRHWAFAVAGTYVLVLTASQWLDARYPGWKIALTTSLFVPVVMGLAVDAPVWQRPWVRRMLGVVYLAALCVAAVEHETRHQTHVGVTAAQEALVNRLRELPGDTFLVGNLESESALRWEHPMAYLFAAHRRNLYFTPGLYSYYATGGPPAVLPRNDGRPEYAIQMDPNGSFITGALLAEYDGVRLFDITGPRGAAMNIAFANGWYPAEQEPDRRFRWSRTQSLFHADLRGDGCWKFEVRTTPGVAAARLWIRWGSHSDAYAIREIWTRLTLPARGAYGLHAISMEFEGPAQAPRDDHRDLRFALANPEWHDGADCAAPPP